MRRSLTIQEAMLYCGISRSCLSRWEASRQVRRHVRGSDEKIVYLLHDLDRMLLSKPKRGRKARRTK